MSLEAFKRKKYNVGEGRGGEKGRREEERGEEEERREKGKERGRDEEARHIGSRL